MSTNQDDDRPPVLAHLRFVAERSTLSGLELAERFRHIHRTNLWGAPGSVSGLGSESGATGSLRQQLPRLLRRLGAASLLDAPCGDGGWISELDIGLSYTGIDIVPELIEDLRRRAEGHGAPRTYLVADITRNPLPRVDAILCRDCLVHLSFSNIAAALANFRRSGSEWLVTTTFPELKANVDCEDGDWRALNFAVAPFNWPARSICSWRVAPKAMAAGRTRALRPGRLRNCRSVPGSGTFHRQLQVEQKTRPMFSAGF